MGPGSSSAPISLDDLIALNDEIIALVRAGVPLEEGVHDLSRDLPGELGELATTLPRACVVARVSSAFFKTRAAVCRRSTMQWSKPASAPAVSRQDWRALAHPFAGCPILRRVISLAMIYPLFVFLLTYALFVFLVVKLAPVMAAADWTHSHPTVLIWLQSLASTAHLWGPIIPILVISFAIYRWRRLGSSAAPYCALPPLSLGFHRCARSSTTAAWPFSAICLEC